MPTSRNFDFPYHCKKCKEDFETMSQIQKHIKRDHPEFTANRSGKPIFALFAKYI